MRAIRAAALVIAAMTMHCLAGVQRTIPGPLEADAEVHVVLRVVQQQDATVAFKVASIAAVRADGAQLPLEVRLPEVQGELSPRELAWGRIEPGAYSGFSLKLAGASRTLAGNTTPLRVPDAPLAVEAPFSVGRARAAVVRLDLDISASLEGLSLSPSLRPSIPPRPLPQLSGWCSSAGQHELTLFDRRARTVAEVWPMGRAPWGLALDPVQYRLYAAISGEDEVRVFDAAAGGELGRIRLQPGDGPREVVLSPDRRTLLVANSGSNTVSFVDPASLLETARVQVGEAPTALLVDRAGNRAYVFNARSSFVSVVDLARRAAVGSIATDYAPLRGAINRAGTRLYVVSQGSPYMTAYSLPDQAQAGRVYVGLGTLAVKVDPASDLLYVAQGGSHRLALFDPFSLMPIDFVDLPGDASYLAIDDAENTMFGLMPEQRAAAVVDLATKQLLAVIDVGLDPRMLVLAGERN